MYSPRPGTLSARWEDDVPHAEKQRRHRELEKLQERIQTEINAERLGKTYEVLVEGRSKGPVDRAHARQHAAALRRRARSDWEARRRQGDAHEPVVLDG